VGDYQCVAIYRSVPTAATVTAATMFAARYGDFLRWRTLTLALIPPDAPSVPTFAYAVIGGVTGSEAKVYGQTAETESDLDLLVSESSGLTGAASHAGSNPSGDFWQFDVDGLDPDTVYYYGFAEGAAFGSF